MKARIYKTSKRGNNGCEDTDLENTLQQNSIPYIKDNIEEGMLGYTTDDFEYCYYYIYINNLEELLGINRIFKEELIISECDTKEVGYDLEIEIYDAWRE